MTPDLLEFKQGWKPCCFSMGMRKTHRRRTLKVHFDWTRGASNCSVNFPSSERPSSVNDPYAPPALGNLFECAEERRRVLTSIRPRRDTTDSTSPSIDGDDDCESKVQRKFGILGRFLGSECPANRARNFFKRHFDSKTRWKPLVTVKKESWQNRECVNMRSMKPHRLLGSHAFWNAKSSTRKGQNVVV